MATGGGITVSVSPDGNTINPGWSHSGSPIGAPPTNWQLVYFNPGPNSVAIQAFAECAKLVDTPPTEPASLIVIKEVRCSGSEVRCLLPSAFQMRITVNDVLTDTFAGSPSPGTEVDIEPGSYSVDETIPEQPAGQSVTTAKSVDCSGTTSAGETKTCTITNSINLDQPPVG